MSANVTGFGLVMLTAYVAASALCLVAASTCRQQPHHRRGAAGIAEMARERRLWQALAALLAILAMYRQFDLTELVTGIGRMIAIHGHWFKDRRPYQLALVWGTAIAIVAAAAAIFRLVAAANPLVLAALAAGTMLVLLFAINALSFHVVDIFFHSGYRRVTIYNVIEVGSVATILAATLCYRQRAVVADRR